MFERPQTTKQEVVPALKLGEAMRAWSASLNQQFKTYLQEPKRAGNILNDECRIDMRAFLTKRGGPYQKEGSDTEHGVRDDEQIVQIHELSWSGARNPGAKERYGDVPEEVMLQKWRENAAKHDGSLAEAAVICVLNKMLGERFIAVRASEYDDYDHGVDMLIIDRETGGVVCAFDEVVGTVGDERHQKKVSRAKEKLSKHGGMQVKYGLTLEQSEDGALYLTRKTLPNVPGFCISLSREDLHELLREGQFSPGSPHASTEKKLFDSICVALKTQELSMKERMTPEQCTLVDTLISFAETRLAT